MLRLIIYVDGQELATDIYFKTEQAAEMWIKHHYLVISQLVWLLKNTRDFTLEKRRT